MPCSGFCQVFIILVSLTRITQEQVVRSGRFWYCCVAPDVAEGNVQQNCTIIFYMLRKWRKCSSRFNSFRDKTTSRRTVKFGWFIEFLITRGNVQQNITKVIREKSYVVLKFCTCQFLSIAILSIRVGILFQFVNYGHNYACLIILQAELMLTNVSSSYKVLQLMFTSGDNNSYFVHSKNFWEMIVDYW